MTRILGLDPGYGRLGYGVIDAGDTDTLHHIAAGVITTAPAMPMPRRLAEILADVRSLLMQHVPARVAVERLVFVRNITTGIAVAEARGVVLAACHQLPVYEYSPMTVKAGVTGSGRASKAEVGEAVRALLGLERVPRPDDAADALAVAICDAAEAVIHARVRVAR